MAVALMLGSVVASNAADPIVHIPTYNSQVVGSPFEGLTFGSGFAVEHNEVFPTVTVGYGFVDGVVLYLLEALATVKSCTCS